MVGGVGARRNIFNTIILGWSRWCFTRRDALFLHQKYVHQSLTKQLHPLHFDTIHQENIFSPCETS